MHIKSDRARLLAAATVLHLALALIIYLLGRFDVPNALFNREGISPSLADDGLIYLEDVRSLVEILWREGFHAWATVPFPFHVKLYSLSFALLSPFVGFNTLSAEPVNLLCYVSSLWTVCKLGGEVFEKRAGVIAVLIVGLWPSFLLHTTQLLKDPIFIAAMLALVYINLRWLTRDYGWREGLSSGVAAGAAAVLLWFVRSESWELTLAVILIGCALVVVRQFRERRVSARGLLGAALMLLISLSVPPLMRETREKHFPSSPPPAATSDGAKAQVQNDSLGGRIGKLRLEFATEYPNAASNIDAGVQFDDTADMLRYLPRAVCVGLLAPFPDMWLKGGGDTGRVGRLVSGSETMLMYLLMPLSLFGLWRRRLSLPAWLLFLVSLVGAAALGLVVINVGALYRLRYAFWMPLVILGAGGMVQLFSALAQRRRAQIKEPLPLLVGLDEVG